MGADRPAVFGSPHGGRCDILASQLWPSGGTGSGHPVVQRARGRGPRDAGAEAPLLAFIVIDDRTISADAEPRDRRVHLPQPCSLLWLEPPRAPTLSRP